MDWAAPDRDFTALSHPIGCIPFLVCAASSLYTPIISEQAKSDFCLLTKALMPREHRLARALPIQRIAKDRLTNLSTSRLLTKAGGN